MKYIILILSILMIFNISHAFGMLQIKLESISQEFILGESADVIKITWKNDGDKDLIIPYRIKPFHDNERLIKWHVIGPSRIECKQRREPEIKWEPFAHEILKAGNEKSLPISLGQLGIVDVGQYEIWMDYDSTILASRWDDIHITRMKATSNHIKIELNNPIGIDAEIFNKYKAECNQLMISGLEILKSYPSSTYAAWALENYLGKAESADPKKIKELIYRNLYPIWNSVPDPLSGEWKGLRGKELALWQIKWSEFILANHPDFALAKRLKLTIAINNIVLGDKEKAKRILNELAKEHNHSVSQWVQEFLSIMDL